MLTGPRSPSPSDASSYHNHNHTSGHSHPALKAQHVETARSGLCGNKQRKKRQVQSQLRAMLQVFSPRPDEANWLPEDYLGHRLGWPIMNTGGNSRNDAMAGSWVQMCGGCPQCLGGTKRAFVITGPLPRHVLGDPSLRDLFSARADLYGKPAPSAPSLRLAHPKAP
ncbi:hypothetical protein B0H13DRAFT_2325965 [Mycena leptocephala]|nr:hypothetical protein B0H13DRAFT_2325965 [Mycena leptocephala]